MFDNPKVSLPDWFTLSSRPLGGAAPDRLHAPEQGARPDSRAAGEEVSRFALTVCPLQLVGEVENGGEVGSGPVGDAEEVAALQVVANRRGHARDCRQSGLDTLALMFYP